MGGAAHAGLPRILVADLHGQGDLKEIGVGVSVLEAASLSRSGQVEVVSREAVIKAFGKVGLPARDGLWLGPSEARAVCEATQCTQILIGTFSRDAAKIYLTLRLLQHDGSVAKTVKLTHPLRQLPMLSQAVAQKAREILRIDAPTPPAARAPTLTALGGAWIAAQKRDADFAVIEAELAGQPAPIALQFAAPAGDLVAAVGAITENPTAKLRIEMAIDPRAALKQAEALADSKPNDTQARFLYARTLLEAGKGKEALTLLAPKEGETEIAEAHELRGRAQLLLRNLPKAKEELSRAVELDTQNAEAHYFYGDVLAKTGDARAVSEYQIASEGLRRKGDGRATDAIIRALQTDVRMARATDLDARDMLPDDVAAARRTLEHAGNDPTFAPSRAAVEAAAGDMAASSKALAVAREHNPSDGTLAKLMARVSAEQGDHKAALAAYEQALKVKSTPELALDAAREAAATGDLAKARDFYVRAMGSPATQDVATRELGQLELEKGDKQQAVELLKKAAAAEPDDAEVHLRLAQALSATGDTSGANAEKLAANALDPDVAVERPLPGATTGGTEVGKPTLATPTAGGASESQAVVELIGQLPQLLRSFPPLKEKDQGGSAAIVHGTVPLMSRILPGRRANAAAMDKALATLLETAFRFERVLPASESSATDPTSEALAQLAGSKNVDVVVAYTTEVDDGRIKVAMTVLDQRQHKLYNNEARLNAPSAVGSQNLLPIEIIIVVLVGLVGWLVFRPRGKLNVKIEYDPTMDGGMFSIRIYKMRRGGIGLKGGNEQSYVDAVRKSGASVSSRAATMVGKETEFKLPAGKWWVYVFGVYVKNNKPQGNFLIEKRVIVPGGKLQTAEFNLIPQETSVLVKVLQGGNTVFGAAVWLNQDEHKAVYTNKSAGGALILVPRGQHIVTARMDGKQMVQDLSVSSPQPMECVVDMTHAEPAPEERETRARAPEAVAATAMTPSSMHDVHSSLQGNMYDLPAESGPSPSATAVANATRYELRRELGRGAMGVVYEAYDTVLERSVALKVISQELKDRPDVVELFMREARSLAQLNHPNIVTVFDFGQRGAEYFMALEVVQGRTLEEIMSGVGGPMPLGQVIDIAIEVCSGLAFAHERRVIHRDIKPANIFLLDDGRVKIMDFGLARVVRELSIKKTMISGTPLYMSPEQIRGTDLDFRADLYSLGCMVYEMLCGTPPFYQGEILYHHSHTMPDPPTSRLPSLPPDVDAVLMRCLEKDKEARYSSVAEFAQALKGLKARLSGREAAI
jgi:tetratricopeptide (TPR) repeat protein